MYSVDIQNGGLIKKIKGIKSSVVKNTITFDDYLQCLRKNTIISREQHNICTSTFGDPRRRGKLRLVLTTTNVT
uniref:Uncharacterized protein n=1 Tax=Trichogramma kaykai TaxID=54128 RepID=A0ABD2WM42_9HYME